MIARRIFCRPRSGWRLIPIKGRVLRVFVVICGSWSMRSADPVWTAIQTELARKAA
jgi:hypothetical protein